MGYSPPRKTPQGEVAPPFATSLLSFMLFSLVFLLGWLRDIIENVRGYTRKGYAPLREPQEDFYQRRVFSRIRDCYNRPIASAPDAWVDVMDRTNICHSSGFKEMKTLGTKQHCLNLSSYNYLGFAASDAYCTPRVQATTRELGVSSCSSRSDAGTTPVHEELERLTADFVGKEAAVTFGMGYATNSAVIPALMGKGCLIISDQLNHASIVSGARASGAKVKVFRHNDPNHLERVLRTSIAEGQPRMNRPWKKIMIFVEGIYSMEGEACSLARIVELKKKYGVYLYLDEAHSIGALGRRGRGACEHWGVDPADVDVMMGTFTKSFGSCGGYIAASRPVIDYLRRHSPAHLYATAMSPGAVQQVISAMRLINGEDGTTRGLDKVKQLHDNANYFRRQLISMGLHVLGDWDSPVMPIMIYHPGKIAAVSRLCLSRCLAMVVVGFPATSLLLTRARVCISASHTREDLDYALSVIRDVAHMCMMQYGLCTTLPPPHPHPTDPASVQALDTWGDFKDCKHSRLEDLPPAKVAKAAGLREQEQRAQAQAVEQAKAAAASAQQQEQQQQQQGRGKGKGGHTTATRTHAKGQPLENGHAEAHLQNGDAAHAAQPQQHKQQHKQQDGKANGKVGAAAANGKLGAPAPSAQTHLQNGDAAHAAHHHTHHTAAAKGAKANGKAHAGAQNGAQNGDVACALTTPQPQLGGKGKAAKGVPAAARSNGKVAQVHRRMESSSGSEGEAGGHVLDGHVLSPTFSAMKGGLGIRAGA